LPWKGAVAKRYFPYTFDWHSLAALSCALDAVEAEGLKRQIERHHSVARYCRQRIRNMGFQLYVNASDDEVGFGFAATVTAAYVPLRARGGHFDSWEEFDAALRSHGLVLAGSYGPLAGQVFRVGHMGSQANQDLVAKGLAIIEAVIAQAKAPKC